MARAHAPGQALAGPGSAALLAVCAAFALYVGQAYLARPPQTWGEAVGEDFASGWRAWLFGPHIVAGSIATLLGPAQLLPWCSRATHGWVGRAVLLCSTVASVFGIAFAALFGTHGGPVMTASFIAYGVALAVTAWATWRSSGSSQGHLRQIWGTRLAFLSAGSAIYRILVLPVFLASLWGSGDSALLSPEVETLCLNAGAVAFVPVCLGLAHIAAPASREAPRSKQQ